MPQEIVTGLNIIKLPNENVYFVLRYLNIYIHALLFLIDANVRSDILEKIAEEKSITVVARLAKMVDNVKVYHLIILVSVHHHL